MFWLAVSSSKLSSLVFALSHCPSGPLTGQTESLQEPPAQGRRPQEQPDPGRLRLGHQAGATALLLAVTLGSGSEAGRAGQPELGQAGESHQPESQAGYSG